MNLIEKQKKEIKDFLNLTEQQKIDKVTKYIETKGFYPYDERDFIVLKTIDPIANNIFKPEATISNELKSGVYSGGTVIIAPTANDLISDVSVGDEVVLASAELTPSSIKELSEIGIKGAALMIANVSQITMIKRKQKITAE